MSVFRYLTIGEALFAAKRLRELGRLDHLVPAGADESDVRRFLARQKIVGCFADDEGELRFVYWTYKPDAVRKRRYIAVAALGQLDRTMLADMRHGVRHLTREWELWGEVDDDNARGIKLGQLCGFTVEGVLDGQIIVKHQRQEKTQNG